MEAEAVQEMVVVERDCQHRLRVAGNHKKVQLEKVASKRQKEQETFEKYVVDVADKMNKVDAALLVAAPKPATAAPAAPPQQPQPPAFDQAATRKKMLDLMAS